MNCSLRVVLFCITILCPSVLIAGHGISIDGRLKYPNGFERFSYTSAKAVKGGSLILHDLGGFDKMNPFTLKGIAPFGLEMFVFEPLVVTSLDEPFAAYGLIAKDIELAEDKLSVVFTLNEMARFSDGTPVTVEDVKYSLEMLKSDKAHPARQIYYRDITSADILDKQKIRFNFSQKNRELHLIAGQLRILSKKFYEKNGFDPNDGEKSMIPPIGSGPYIVEKVKNGSFITYRRNPNYWAVDHPTRRGMFNFNTIAIKYFKDQTVGLEALKAGDFDFMAINIAKQWRRDLVGPGYDRGALVKKNFDHKNNAGMQGFVFNTRRDIFKDPKVRRALGLALDFEWTNKTLFFDQYTRSNSYFSNSELAAKGLPVGEELQVLEKYRDVLPAEVFSTSLTPPSTVSPASLRGNLRHAKKLLNQAGWFVRDGVLKNKEGVELSFEILLRSPFFERVMAPYVKNLQKLGVKASYRRVDMALYIDRIKRFDFDMVVTVFGQSQSPGNEQRSYWHSSSAVTSGSDNLAGVDDPVVDDLVDKIIYADTMDELRTACRALDRVLWYGYYVVPSWYLPYHRLTYSSRFHQPEKLPLYYNPYLLLMTWWDGDNVRN